MDSVRWGIIGCGNVTEVKSGPAFYKTADSELVAVMRRDSDKAKDYAARHKVLKWYSDADELIGDRDVNAVYVATPPDSHAEYTIKAAGAGKCVYVEKPMALNYGQCLEMIEACERAGVGLYVAYYRRCLPDFVKIKELIEEGAIGEVRVVNIELYHAVKKDVDPSNPVWRVVPEISGGGYFMDLASHQLDFLDYILGPISRAFGSSGNQAGLYPAEDIVTAHFEFASGVLGAGSWCFSVSGSAHTDRTEIVGNRGRIIYSSFDVGDIVLETDKGEERFKIPRPEHVQGPLIKTVVDDLLGRGVCPSTGLSGARTSRILEMILKGSS